MGPRARFGHLRFTRHRPLSHPLLDRNVTDRYGLMQAGFGSVRRGDRHGAAPDIRGAGDRRRRRHGRTVLFPERIRAGARARRARAIERRAQRRPARAGAIRWRASSRRGAIERLIAWMFGARAGSRQLARSEARVAAPGGGGHAPSPSSSRCCRGRTADAGLWRATHPRARDDRTRQLAEAIGYDLAAVGIDA